MDDTLLIRFIERKTNREEAISVLAGIEESDENRKYFAQLQTIWAAKELCNTGNHDTAAVENIINKVCESNKMTTIYNYIAVKFATLSQNNNKLTSKYINKLNKIHIPSIKYTKPALTDDIKTR